MGEGIGYGGDPPVSVDKTVRNSLLLWVARLDEGTELKVTDPKEQQGDVEEE